jgi:DNA-binding CsgD family transcriptional regulator
MTDAPSATFDGLSALVASAELSCCELDETATVLHRWLGEHYAHEAIAITTNASGTPVSRWTSPAFELPPGFDWSSATVQDDLGRPVVIAGGDAASANATIVVVLTAAGARPCAWCEDALHGLARVLAGRIGCPSTGGDTDQVARAHAVAGERDRVTHELTDGFAQHLHGIVGALRAAGGSPHARMHAAAGVASRALVELREPRRPVWGQARRVDEAFGALERDLGDLARAAGIAFEPDLAGPHEQHLPDAVLDAACWITRAAMLNVVEHAGAARARIEWHLDADALVLAVADDGRGFDAEREAGEGIDAMRWRTETLDGTLDVESAPGWGTRVEARLGLLIDNGVQADESSSALVRTLGDRELDVLRLMALGHRNRDIAAELFLSQHTVKFHVGRIFEKLGVSTRAEAAAVAFAAGIDSRQPPAAAAA